jgi:hypothetical protein
MNWHICQIGKLKNLDKIYNYATFIKEQGNYKTANIFIFIPVISLDGEK